MQEEQEEQFYCQISASEVVLQGLLSLFWQTQSTFAIPRMEPIHPYLCICLSFAYVLYN